MAKYKLTYFNVSGSAEPIRYLLAYIGEEFEDVRVKRDDWPAMKPTTPFGKLPIFEVDGKVINQSLSICRYLAAEAKLNGKDNWETLQIDSIVETLRDLKYEALVPVFLESDETKKAAKLDNLLNNSIPFYFGKFNELVEKNGGYFVNGKLSWADIVFSSQIDFLFSKLGVKSTLSEYPSLAALRDKVLAVPKIAEYLAKRPPLDA